MATKPRPAEELRGLVYSLTPLPRDEGQPWYSRPASLAAIVLALTVALNFLFW
jgi:SSS family solute:Na+ symporter